MYAELNNDYEYEILIFLLSYYYMPSVLFIIFSFIPEFAKVLLLTIYISGTRLKEGT